MEHKLSQSQLAQKRITDAFMWQQHHQVTGPHEELFPLDHTPTHIVPLPEDYPMTHIAPIVTPPVGIPLSLTGPDLPYAPHGYDGVLHEMPMGVPLYSDLLN